MEKSKENEELLKDNIFTLFSECISESPIEPKDKLFIKLCDQIFRWCKGYLYKTNTEEMGLEILKAVENTIKNVKNEKYFFGYLINRLKEAQNQYYRVRIKGSVNINKTFKGIKLKDIKKVLEIKEGNIAKKLTQMECIKSLSEWYKWDEEESLECIIIINREFSSENELSNNNSDDNLNYLDSNVSSPYMDDVFMNPLNEYFHKDNINKIKEAIKVVLDKKPITRDCKKALFTLYCIDKKQTDGLLPVLDKEIIESCKDGKKPTKYEVCWKFHPEITNKGSAGATATANLNEFLFDLEVYLKEKNPEIFP